MNYSLLSSLCIKTNEKEKLLSQKSAAGWWKRKYIDEGKNPTESKLTFIIASTRVTRRVGEKIAQNVAQPLFVRNIAQP
jgi:hypothetical protein